MSYACPRCHAIVEDHAAFCWRCGLARRGGEVPAPVSVEDASPDGLPYAGFVQRLIAHVIDSGLLLFALFLLGVLGIVDFGWRRRSGASLFSFGPCCLNIVPAVMAWLYYAVQESGPQQATLGKRIVGLRVVGSDGQRLSFGQATGRFLGKMLSWSMFTLGFWVMLFSPRRQTLHDILASTLVIQTGARRFV